MPFEIGDGQIRVDANPFLNANPFPGLDQEEDQYENTEQFWQKNINNTPQVPFNVAPVDPQDVAKDGEIQMIRPAREAPHERMKAKLESQRRSQRENVSQQIFNPKTRPLEGQGVKNPDVQKASKNPTYLKSTVA